VAGGRALIRDELIDVYQLKEKKEERKEKRTSAMRGILR
jgi:hypothetical protein